jgi:hypothetical protein
VLDERLYFGEEPLEVGAVLGGDEVPGRHRHVVGRPRPCLLLGTNHCLPHPWLWKLWTTLLLRDPQKPQSFRRSDGDCRTFRGQNLHLPDNSPGAARERAPKVHEFRFPAERSR